MWLSHTKPKSKLLSHNFFSHFQTPKQSFSGKQKLQLGMKTVICFQEVEHIYIGIHTCVCQFIVVHSYDPVSTGLSNISSLIRELDSEERVICSDLKCCAAKKIGKAFM